MFPQQPTSTLFPYTTLFRSNTDVFPVIVVKAPDGWVAFLDSNLNGSFEDEMPLHDYRQGRETIALGTKPITLAANFGESSGVPTLAFVFDNNAHGTHVAGIAGGTPCSTSRASTASHRARSCSG